MKPHYLAAALALVSIAGCEAPPVTPGDANGQRAASSVLPTVPADRASLVFIRGNEFAGSANVYRIFVNGTAVADMSVGTRHVEEVIPGNVSLSAETVANILNFGLGLAVMEKPQLQLQAKAGQLYVIEIDPGFAGGPVFKVGDAQSLSSTHGFTQAKAPVQ
jgi:hypothetical protein